MSKLFATITAIFSFVCHPCGQGDHGNCAGGINRGGLCGCCPNRF